ncbi:MAG: hypothetical protein Q8916_10380 [Bacteroidota bacterium]|nr:hypothetical protein [Bacteroidota bacterium]MDP4230795.1 hypothetical protein [Bacteroidota bacterium]MDP4235908.1 hypothetical protein [Bacteroidota bacterium]
MKTSITTFCCCLALLVIHTSAGYGQTDTSFKPSGKLNLLLFGDYSYKLHADSANRGLGQYSGVPKAFANFQIRRFYLGYNYDLSPNFTTEFLLAYEDGGGASATLDAGSERSFYLKFANIRWKNILPGQDVVFGAQPTQAFVTSSEKVWLYRSIEKTLLDKNKIAGASDIGIALQGAFDEKNFGYDILYGNGSAQKLENDKFKKLSGDLWAKFLDKRIIVQFYADLNRTSDVPAKDNSTLKLMLAYQTKPLTIGVEGFLQTQANAVIRAAKVQDSSGSTETLDIKPQGISVFIEAQLLENTLNGFLRYDLFDPDHNFDGNLVGYPAGYSSSKESFIVGGLDWTPYPNIHIMPNLWYTGYSSKADGSSGKLQSDNDFVSRITVFYKF